MWNVKSILERFKETQNANYQNAVLQADEIGSGTLFETNEIGTGVLFQVDEIGTGRLFKGKKVNR